jgi:hypothetical protein
MAFDASSPVQTFDRGPTFVAPMDCAWAIVARGGRQRRDAQWVRRHGRSPNIASIAHVGVTLGIE